MCSFSVCVLFFVVAFNIDFLNKTCYRTTVKTGRRCGKLLGDYNGTFINTKGHSPFIFVRYKLTYLYIVLIF